MALLPTGTDDLLGTEKWGLGPTVVLLKQQGPWTYGALVNHIWSVAGDDSRSDPIPRETYYFLVQARNSCGATGFELSGEVTEQLCTDP